MTISREKLFTSTGSTSQPTSRLALMCDRSYASDELTMSEFDSVSMANELEVKRHSFSAKKTTGLSSGDCEARRLIKPVKALICVTDGSSTSFKMLTDTSSADSSTSTSRLMYKHASFSQKKQPKYVFETNTNCTRVIFVWSRFNKTTTTSSLLTNKVVAIFNAFKTFLLISCYITGQ